MVRFFSSPTRGFGRVSPSEKPSSRSAFDLLSARILRRKWCFETSSPRSIGFARWFASASRGLLLFAPFSFLSDALTLFFFVPFGKIRRRTQRLKNTSMPTRDMERFVELSHREEEDEEDMQGRGGGDGAMNNTTNNNNSVGSFETNGNADRRMMEHSKSHPRMLKSTFFLFSLSLLFCF